MQLMPHLVGLNTNGLRAALRGEFLKLRKRPATWVLGIIATYVLVASVYIESYTRYVQEQASVIPTDVFPEFILQGLQPNQVAQALLAQSVQRWGFYAIGLVLGALTAGSEYNWGTLKTSMTQGPSRLSIYGGQVFGVLMVLATLTPTLFALAIVASIISVELLHGLLVWPSGWMLLKGMGVAFLLLAMPAGMGLMLAVLLRGTALAIGAGLAWLLVLEQALQTYGFSSPSIMALVNWLPRSNSDSLAMTLGQWAAEVPGQEPPPPVHGTSEHFVVVLIFYIFAFVAVGAAVLRNRDVSA